MKNSLKLTLICVAALTIICIPFTATAEPVPTPEPVPPNWNPGEKIEGPWLWMIASTGINGGAAAATSGIDYLAAVSGGSVTEQQIAMNGATLGASVGSKVWTPGFIWSYIPDNITESDNITAMVYNVGLGTGDIDNHVAYGSISLVSPRRQDTTMYIGSDDAVKVWLNGVLVHNNPVNRGLTDYQESVPVILKQGKNILLVAVYEGRVNWGGFFGFDADAVYSVTPIVRIPAAERPPMYWLNNYGTRLQLTGDAVETVSAVSRREQDLAIDAVDSKIYWTEIITLNPPRGAIKRANLDDSNVQLVKNLTSIPRGIAVDSVNDKLYVTNSWGKVQRMNLNGSNFESDLITGLNFTDLWFPTSNITIDTANGKIYWIEVKSTDPAQGTIKRANLNGSNVQLVKNLTSIPHGIAVDSVNDKLYVTNSWGKVQRMNLNGSNFESDLITNLELPGSIAVDTANSKIYWTMFTGIQRANLDGTNIQAVVTAAGFSVTDLVLNTSSTMDDTVTMAPPSADINEDGSINATDLLSVVTALQGSEAAPSRTDVNGDGAVNVADLLLVIENLDDPVNAAAPTNKDVAVSLDPIMLASHIHSVRAESDGSPKYQHALAFLQNLLAAARPEKMLLLANYPNPFNPETWIPYQLAEPAEVTVSIHTSNGKLVRTLTLGELPAGVYQDKGRAAYWDGTNEQGEAVASGVYFYTLTAGDFTATKKMLIRK